MVERSNGSNPAKQRHSNIPHHSAHSAATEAAEAAAHIAVAAHVKVVL
jgi:hypothetical protein